MFVTIKNSKLMATIARRGAELKSLLSNQNVEYLWSSNPTYWEKSAPFLFPIVGKLKDHKTNINGKIYEMKNHGYIQYQLFEVVEQTSDYVKLVHHSNEETKTMYPFDYRFVVEYRLYESSLQTSVHIENTSTNQIYFNFGGHPALACPILEGEKFTDYRIVFEKEETFDSPFVEKDATLDFNTPAFRAIKLKELPLYRELFSIDTIIIPAVASNVVWLLNKKNKGIKFSYEGFTTFSIWSPYTKEAPFVCLEPWQGYNDVVGCNSNFQEKADLIKLEPTKKYQAMYTIEIVD